MREIGRIPGEKAAHVFCDYLTTLEINSQAEAAGSEWVVWVHDEDRLDQSRAELEQFLASPGDSKYAKAGKQAARVREDEMRRTAAAARQRIDSRRQLNQPIAARCPITFALMVFTAMTVISTTDFRETMAIGEKEFPVRHRFWIEPPFDDAGRPRSEHKLELTKIQSGELWRVITPIFLHFGFLHFVFNMMWLFNLGVAVELRRGSWRTLLLVLAIAAISNLAQYYAKGPMFGGMSGVDYGLFGFVWMKSRYDPRAGFAMPQSTVLWMMAWFVICLTPAVPAANWAHGMGLLVGSVVSLFPVVLRGGIGR